MKTLLEKRLAGAALAELIQKLYSLNTDAYDMGVRTTYLDSEHGQCHTGMRTDQLAVWIISERERTSVDVLNILKMKRYRYIDADTIRSLGELPSISDEEAWKIIQNIKAALKN